MKNPEKLDLLKSLRLFDKIPKDQLAALADFLEPLPLEDGNIVFEEGSGGDSLFFISSGRIRILKKVLQADATTSHKDLAILQAGDCFGEMALFDLETPRSARATALGKTLLFRLERKQLLRWLESNPKLAVGFFTELAQVLSKRLRRSSNELALLFDLSQWLLEPVASGKELLQKVLGHLVPHLEGAWSAGAYLYNEFNDEMELVASEGRFATVAEKIQAPNPKTGASWLNGRTYLVTFLGKKHLRGYLVFHSVADLTVEEKSEFARTLTTTSRLIASAIENINFRTEEALRERLAASRGYGKGF